LKVFLLKGKHLLKVAAKDTESRKQASFILKVPDDLVRVIDNHHLLAYKVKQRVSEVIIKSCRFKSLVIQTTDQVSIIEYR